MAATSLEHVLDRSRRDVKEAGEVYRDHGVELLDGVLREWLADVDSCVVDQRVDSAKALDRLVKDALRRVRVGNVAPHGHDAGVLRRLDRSSCRDHGVSELTVCRR